MTDEPSDEALMQAHQDGDRNALRLLFVRYEKLVLRVLARDLDTPEEARDLAQQAFLQLHRARADYEPGRAFRPWFFTIVLNLKREHFRRRARRNRAFGGLLERQQVTESEFRAEEPERSAEAVRLRRALDVLPEIQREAIVLHYFEEFSFAEIATMLGVGESALKVRAHRGYARLRELLADSDSTPSAARRSPSSSPAARTTEGAAVTETAERHMPDEASSRRGGDTP